ncbi:peptidase M16 [Solimonas fluminis]|uniref:Peptidase M16 n=1 Tax=Solimonas fluminis TaxID=2086571 RepID=A0A2S5TII9_9GAMM|nr:pitrilysin family protein [Solimonas fluminis]PPE74799.1 peptidase M16 [Solimonas fluminis]
MRKALLAALGLLLSQGHATAAAPAQPAFPDLRIPYEKHILPNGLTLILHEDHKAPLVAVNVWYHVGSKDEPPGRQGFAHLFEHLMFNGSEHYNDEFFRPLAEAGATKINGTTWMDRTNYFQNVPTPALDRVLWLESDRMGHLLGAVDQAKLDEQRGVVLNEKRQGENQPYGRVWDVISRSIYPAGHPYSWTTIGSEKDLNAATLDDVKSWFRAHYGAANATLVVAGDIDPAEVLKKVQLYFGDIPSGPVRERIDAWPAKRQGAKRSVLQDRVPQPRIIKVWNTPGLCDGDSTLLNLAGSILADGRTSRLYQRLVYRDRTATSVSSASYPFEIAAPMTLDAYVQPGGDAAAVDRVMEEELARFLRTGPTPAELQRAKTRYFAARVRGLEQIDGRAGKSGVLATYQVYCGSPDALAREADLIRKATPADVQRAARAWLDDGAFTLTVEPFPEYSTADQGADRSKLPERGKAPGLRLPPLQRFTLSNGLKVALAEYPSAPVVQLSLLVDAGYAADLGGTPGTARLMLEMLDEGTPTRDALQIAARKETLGAELAAMADLDSFLVSLNALSGRLPESLELFADVLLRPAFPQKELDRIRQQIIAAVQQEKAQPAGIAGRLYPRLIYGEGHAYSGPLSGLGSEEQLAKLSVADLRAFYARWMRPDQATLLVVGDTREAQIRPLLEQYLGAWKAPAEPAPQKQLAEVALPQKPRVFLVNRSGSQQSYILAAHLAPPLRDPDDIAMRLAADAFGGDFLSRVNLNLREDKHWSYGVRSEVMATQAQRPFALRAPVQTDKTVESIKELLREYQELTGQRPLQAQEVRDAQDRTVRRLPGANETSGEIAGSYGTLLKFGLPDSYWNDLVGKVEALDAEAVNAAAKRLVQPQALTWLIVGDLEKIEAGVRKLELGEVTVLDSDGKVLR